MKLTSSAGVGVFSSVSSIEVPCRISLEEKSCLLSNPCKVLGHFHHFAYFSSLKNQDSKRWSDLFSVVRLIRKQPRNKSWSPDLCGYYHPFSWLFLCHHPKTLTWAAIYLIHNSMSWKLRWVVYLVSAGLIHVVDDLLVSWKITWHLEGPRGSTSEGWLSVDWDSQVTESGSSHHQHDSNGAGKCV